MNENKKRSLVKAVSRRLFATLTTMLIVLIFFTRKIVISAGVGIFELISKFLLYYIHERLWGKFNWGKQVS